MGALIFLTKFSLATGAYFLGLSAVAWLFGRINDSSLSLREAASTLAGTHLGRLRFLCVAAAISLVLTFVYPGPALLFDLGDAFEPVRKSWYWLMYGKDAAQHYSPPAPKTVGTWFWGQAALIYVGTFILYIVLALPDMLRSAIQIATEARDARKRTVHSQGPGGAPRRSAAAEFMLVAVGTFLGAILAQLWRGNRAN